MKDAIITCLDEDILIDDNVGQTKVDILNFCKKNGHREWVKLYYHGIVSAEVLILSKFLSVETKNKQYLSNMNI